jgi:asparagine synthase (glutamine-hydrolysing)
MCGIVGTANYKRDISNEYPILKKMTTLLKKRGPDEDGYYLSKHVNLGHRRLSVIDIENGKQPMSFTYNEITYTIVYNGQIYNTQELKADLIKNGFTFKGHSDTEILLKSYILYGKDICNHLNGIFAFAIHNSKTDELFLARDQFGIKPLYYTWHEDNFVFASEIKSILAYPNITAKLDKTGISELFGIGPSHTPGFTPFKNIFELEPAHFISINKNEFKKTEYWKIKTKPHTDNLEETCEKLRFLIKDSVEKQLVSDVPLCTLLSGGLDSSIITAIASNYYKEKFGTKLNTFSVDYKDQEKYFVKNDFQPNTDNYFIDLMVKEFDTIHHKIVIDSPELFDGLESAVVARDFPGMADVDSSYLIFFKNVKKEATVALSGECSDEIFGGYPWYFRKDSLESNTFPWSLAITERQNLLHPSISAEVNLKEYIDNRYNDSLSKIEFLDEDSEETKLERKLIYLTSNWFMQTLLDRTDRMCMYNGFEVRVPFCDIRIVEYAWNIPWEMKAYEGREKGLLRYAMEGLLPDEIIYRKKSPYPKTHNPSYLKLVKNKLTDIMQNASSPIHTLLNSSYIQEILDTDGASFSRPWFGQLMTGPQLMAYLIQVNIWLEKYHPKIEL